MIEFLTTESGFSGAEQSAYGVYDSLHRHHWRTSLRQLGNSTGRLDLVLLLSMSLVGCVSIQVVPLTAQTYPAGRGAGPVEWLEKKPVRPHIELAHIIATSGTASETMLRRRILERAENVGADAVVEKKSDVLESMGPTPQYQSTLGPAGTSFNPLAGAWGWWNPFYLDPWSFVQGSSDQPTWIEYLSGVAIRYIEHEGDAIGTLKKP